MDANRELLTRMQQVISEHLGVKAEDISRESSWSQLGADSLDRLEMSLAIEDAFQVDIPHLVGERLNTVGDTIDYLSSVSAAHNDISRIRIEAVTTDQQWAEMSRIRTQVFSKEYGFSFSPIPGPGSPGVWHFLARDNHDGVGTLSVVDTTMDRDVHHRYQLSFGKNDRVARYAQLAILKPYRKRGIFELLIQAAHSTIICPNGFSVGWLLYPAQAHSSRLVRSLGFTAEAPLLNTEFGRCHVLTRRESSILQGKRVDHAVPILAATAQ